MLWVIHKVFLDPERTENSALASNTVWCRVLPILKVSGKIGNRESQTRLLETPPLLGMCLPHPENPQLHCLVLTQGDKVFRFSMSGFPGGEGPFSLGWVWGPSFYVLGTVWLISWDSRKSSKICFLSMSQAWILIPDPLMEPWHFHGYYG